MRKFVLSIFLTFLALPVAAAELECAGDLSQQPADVFIEAAAERHSDLNEGQIVDMATMYELAYNQHRLANNEATSALHRNFAERTNEIALQIGAVQLNIFQILPQIESVLKRMEAEEAAGLTRVSDELLPDVRHVAHSQLAISLLWSELARDIVQLETDRLSAIADAGNPDFVAAAHRTVCTIRSTVGVMDAVATFFPDAATLAYVERLNY